MRIRYKYIDLLISRNTSRKNTNTSLLKRRPVQVYKSHSTICPLRTTSCHNDFEPRSCPVQKEPILKRLPAREPRSIHLRRLLQKHSPRNKAKGTSMGPSAQHRKPQSAAITTQSSLTKRITKAADPPGHGSSLFGILPVAVHLAPVPSRCCGR